MLSDSSYQENIVVRLVIIEKNPCDQLMLLKSSSFLEIRRHVEYLVLFRIVSFVECQVTFNQSRQSFIGNVIVL